jgi:hypothetical protein
MAGCSRRSRGPRAWKRRRTSLEIATPRPACRLRDLINDRRDAVPLGELVRAAGPQVHALALLLLALPDAVPLPVPSLSLVLAIPMIVISAHLAAFGEHGGLPARVRTLATPRPVIAAIARYVVPVLAWLERWSRPRLPHLVGRERLAGMFCLFLSLILLLPIPLLNTPPALCVVAIALGLIQRDGVLILGGMAGTGLVTAALVGVIDLTRNVLF